METRHGIGFVAGALAGFFFGSIMVVSRVILIFGFDEVGILFDNCYCSFRDLVGFRIRKERMHLHDHGRIPKLLIAHDPTFLLRFYLISAIRDPFGDKGSENEHCEEDQYILDRDSDVMYFECHYFGGLLKNRSNNFGP